MAALRPGDEERVGAAIPGLLNSGRRLEVPEVVRKRDVRQRCACGDGARSTSTSIVSGAEPSSEKSQTRTLHQIDLEAMSSFMLRRLCNAK